MGAYAARVQRTAASAETVGSLTADATTPRRQKITDLIIGSEAAAADNPFLWEVQRITSAGTSTAVTPQALDPADALALADVGEDHSVEPAKTANAILLSIPLNQRATFRWVAAPGGELVIPATASNGVAILLPTFSVQLVTATIHFSEQ